MDLYIHIYDPEWNGIISDDKNIVDGELIFLVGASNVYSIDVDKVSEELDTKKTNYEIYNLADMSDTPAKRINSMMHLVELEPDVIIYGISMTDFEKARDYQSEFFEYGISEYLLNPNEFFKNIFSYFVNYDFSSFIL